MIYIVLSIFLFSLNNVLWKKNLETAGVFFLISYRSFFTCTISVVLFFAFFNKNNIELESLIKISMGSLIGTIGLFTMLKVLKRASLQWIGIYNLLGIMFTSLYLYLYEGYNLFDLKIGISVIILGYLLFILSNQKSNLNVSFKNHLLLLIMTLSFCMASIIHWSNLISEVHPVLITANQECFVFIFSTLILLFFKKERRNYYHYKLYFKNIAIMSVIILFAVLFSFLGIKQTNPVISSLLFLASPILTILMSSIYFKEKNTIWHYIAIGVIALGAFILKYNNQL